MLPHAALLSALLVVASAASPLEVAEVAAADGGPPTPLDDLATAAVISDTMVAYTAFARGAAAAAPPARRGWQAAAFFACALGMMTKEVMVTAPVMVLLYDRTFWAGSFRAAWQQRWRVHTALAATWLILAVLVLRLGGSRGESAGVGLGVTTWDYALTQFHAVALYLRLAFWPSPLVFDYGWDIIRDASAIWPQIALVAALMAATAASSADARKTLAPLPRRLGKLRVEVETTVDLSATRAWLPMHREQPGISVRAPTLPYVE